MAAGRLHHPPAVADQRDALCAQPFQTARFRFDVVGLDVQVDSRGVVHRLHLDVQAERIGVEHCVAALAALVGVTHREAQRLDPHVSTSVSYTHWMRGDFQAIVEGTSDRDDFELLGLALRALGRGEEEKAALTSDIREVYAEAKGNGFEPRVMRRVVSLRKMKAADREEEEALLEVYRAAVGV